MDAMPADDQPASRPALPARDLTSARLATRMERPGCPVCGHCAELVDRAIGAILYESVNDVAFRAALDEARGLCATHVRRMVAVERSMAGGMLGSAILFDAMLRVRHEELAAVHRSNGLTRGRRAQAATRPPACVICAAATDAERTTIGTLVRLAAEPAWMEALGGADLCLAHLAGAMAVSDRPPGWHEVERRQLERVGALRELVVSFAYHSAHDRRHLITAEEIDSHDRAARSLAGEPPDTPR